MKGTIFEKLTQIYTLKTPSRKSFPKKIVLQIQNLASSFYYYVLKDIIKIEVKDNQVFNNLRLSSQKIREAYTNLFYTLNNKSQKVLDFISCIICLLGDVLFTDQKIQQDKKIQSFITSINKQDKKLREYLYILYVYETLGCKIGKQSVTIIFNQFIVKQNGNHTNIGAKLRFYSQFKQVKQNIQKSGELISFRPRIRKDFMQKNYQLEFKNIIQQNKKQIQQQKMLNTKFQKILNKCITEGKMKLNPSLSKKSIRLIKLSSFLNTMKDIQLSRKPSRVNKRIKQNQRSFQHWRNVLSEMRSVKFMNSIQKIPIFERGGHPNSEFLQPTYINQEAIVNKQRKSSPQAYTILKQKQKCIRRAKISKIQFCHVLPELRQNKQNIEYSVEQNQVTNNIRKLVHSRVLKKQLNQFLSQSVNRKMY